MRKPLERRQTGYSQPIPKAGIGGSPRFAARTPIGIFERVPRRAGTDRRPKGTRHAAQKARLGTVWSVPRLDGGEFAEAAAEIAQAALEAGGIAEEEARHEAEDHVINLAVLGNAHDTAF